MAKKSLKKATKQPAPEAEARQSDSASPAQPQQSNGQRHRPKQATATGAETPKSSAPAAVPGQRTAPGAVSPPPLAPLAALWPTPPPAKGAEKSAQTPARQAQAFPLKVPVPQTAPAPAAPPVKLPVRWQPTALPGEQAVAEVPLPPAPPKIKVTFAVVDLGAKQVSLSGEFNGWSPSATPMKRQEDGHWEATVDLAPGRYQYKFVVDGHWIPDPHAHENVWNRHGTLNSVVEVRA